MLSVYASATAVVCSVFTIQHPDGKEQTPPLSPTMQCAQRCQEELETPFEVPSGVLDLDPLLAHSV